MTGPTNAHERGNTMPESTAPDDGATTDTTEAADLANAYEVVRVRTRAGGHASITRAAAANRGDTIMEGRPALDGRGRPLPGKAKRELTPADKAGPFDPTTASVAAVEKFLATADAAEVTRVLEAEAAGKNRTTITSWSPQVATPTQTSEV